MLPTFSICTLMCSKSIAVITFLTMFGFTTFEEQYLHLVFPNAIYINNVQIKIKEPAKNVTKTLLLSFIGNLAC